MTVIPMRVLSSSPSSLPHSLDAERVLLGATLLDAKVFPRVRELVQAEDFYHPLHREAWNAILELDGNEVDFITVEDWLRRHGQAKTLDVHGPNYLLELTSQVITTENAEWHAKIVRDCARRRGLIELLERAKLAAWNPDEPLAEAVGITQQALRDVEVGPTPAKKRIARAAEAVLEDWQSEFPTPIASGLKALDEKLDGGFMPESTYFLNAATGRGKTGLILQWARHMSRSRPLLYCSSELTRRQALARIVAQEMGQPWAGVYRARPEARPHLAGVLGVFKLYVHHLQLEDDLAKLADQVAEQEGTAPVLVVDYLQHAARRLNPDDRRLAVAALSDQITRWAASRRAVAIVVSAVGRSWSQDEGKSGRDFETAAKESGDVEYDAGGLFHLSTEPCPRGGTSSARLHIAKSRFGGEGSVIGLRFHGAVGTFTEDIAAGLTDDQRSALEAIRGGVTSVEELREQLGMRKTTATNLVKQLAVLGAIQRIPLRVMDGW